MIAYPEKNCDENSLLFIRNHEWHEWTRIFSPLNTLKKQSLADVGHSSEDVVDRR